MIDYLPEVVVVGDIELLFLGAAVALGAPKMARKALEKRYSEDEQSSDETTTEPE